MADIFPFDISEDFECPGCERLLRPRDHLPFWNEARARTEGRPDPTHRPVDPDHCRICGGPLPQRRRRRKDKGEDLPMALPADDAVIPFALPLDADDRLSAQPSSRPPRPLAHPPVYELQGGEAAPPNRRRRKDALAGLHLAQDTRPPTPLLGLTPFLWTLIGVGASALLLLPLSLFFFIPAILLGIVGLGTALVGQVWIWNHYSAHDYGSFFGPRFVRWINYAVNALQDPTGFGRPFLLLAIGMFLFLVSLSLAIFHHKNRPVSYSYTFSASSVSPHRPVALITAPQRQPLVALNPAPPPRQPPPPARKLPPAHEPPSALKFPGLLAYWSFDEGEGKSAADASGNGLHAALVNARWTDGIRGKALSLAGEGSYLDYGDSPRLSFAAQAPFTIAVWMRTTQAHGTLLSQRNSREGGAVIDLLLRNGRIHAEVRQDGNDFFVPVAIESGSSNDGSWHHLALTRHEERIELFLDGVSQGRKSGEQASGAITTDLRALGCECYWLRKGAFGVPHFQGDMDEFCIFERVLKEGEVAKLAGR